MHKPDILYPGYSQGYPRDVRGLHIVAVFGSIEACRELLVYSDDSDPESELYGTPLQTVALNDHLNVVQLLLAWGANINAQPGQYCTALQAAPYGGRKSIVEFLLNHKDPKVHLNILGGTFDIALQAATFEKHEAIIKRLIDRGAHIDAKRGWGRTALHRAAAHGDIGILNILLEKGAKFDMRDGSYGRTPLAVAAWNGHLDTVILLAEKGANIIAVDSQQSTPLHLA